MGGSYRQCGECGKRALSIATRCPGCGRELPAPAVPDIDPALDLSRFLTPRVVAAAVALAAVLAAATLGRAGRLPELPSSPIAADSNETSEVAYAILPVEDPGELRVARTWTNVRRSRSTRADLEAMLLPGDTVVADSLHRGWYRVALDGEVLGYVHGSTLAPPSAPPTIPISQ